MVKQQTIKRPGAHHGAVRGLAYPKLLVMQLVKSSPSLSGFRTPRKKDIGQPAFEVHYIRKDSRICDQQPKRQRSCSRSPRPHAHTAKSRTFSRVSPSCTALTLITAAAPATKSAMKSATSAARRLSLLALHESKTTYRREKTRKNEKMRKKRHTRHTDAQEHMAHVRCHPLSRRWRELAAGLGEGISSQKRQATRSSAIAVSRRATIREGAPPAMSSLSSARGAIRVVAGADAREEAQWIYVVSR